MHNIKIYITFPLILSIGLFLCLGSLTGCKKNKPTPLLPTGMSVQDCTILPPLPRPYIPPKPPKKTFKNKIRQSAFHLFTALQCNALPEARQYATSYGLGTLLSLPFTTIDSFQIIKHQQEGQWATVYIQVNNDKKTIPFLFRHDRNGRWLFEAIDLQTYLHLSPAQILRYYKFDPRNK